MPAGRWRLEMVVVVVFVMVVMVAVMVGGINYCILNDRSRGIILNVGIVDCRSGVRKDSIYILYKYER